MNAEDRLDSDGIVVGDFTPEEFAQFDYVGIAEPWDVVADVQDCILQVDAYLQSFSDEMQNRESDRAAFQFLRLFVQRARGDTR